MIAERILQQAGGTPERIAVRLADRCWTYGRLAMMVERMSVHLEAALAPGEAVGIVMSRRGEPIAALLAAAVHRRPAVLLPDSLPAGELTKLIEQSGIRLLVAPRGFPGTADFTLASAAMKHLEGLDWISLSRAAQTTNDRKRPSEDIRDSDPPNVLRTGDMIVQLTSGSTGESRLAVRTESAVWAEIEALQRRLEFTVEDRVVCGSSIAHSYGLIGGLLAPLACGTEITLAGTPKETRRAIIDRRPHIVVGLASSYLALLLEPDARDAVTQARFLLSAGAPLPPGLFSGFLDAFGAFIRQDYGTTETGTIAIDASGPATEGCAGQTLDHVQVRLQPASDIPLSAGEEGEIQVRSVATARGYLERDTIVPAQNAEGWYATGDAGFWLNGKLYVGRRLRPGITTGGGAVRPEAIEKVVARFPGVRECVALQGEDARGSPGVRLVIAAVGLDVGTIRAWCSEALVSTSQPVAIEVLDELPRSPAGKLLLKYLP